MKKVSRTQLAKAFVALADKANYQRLINELARELVASRRTAEVDLLVRDINRELLRQKRHLEFKVFSAHKLDSGTMQQVERYLKRQTEADSVRARALIEEDLVGGLLVETPDELIDLSLKFKLEQLEA